MRWIANTHDPRNEVWKIHVLVRHGETREQAYATHLKWLEGKIIGEPKGNDTWTAAQLKSMGLVGVYVDDAAAKGGGHEVSQS